MDLIKEALSMGFADAAIMDTKDLVFVPEYRQFCEDNLCGNYNLVPACPPACGTVEEMQAKALKYEKGNRKRLPNNIINCYFNSRQLLVVVGGYFLLPLKIS